MIIVIVAKVFDVWINSKVKYDHQNFGKVKKISLRSSSLKTCHLKLQKHMYYEVYDLP